MDQKLLILVTYHAKPGRGREFLREIEKHGLRETILKEGRLPALRLLSGKR